MDLEADVLPSAQRLLGWLVFCLDCVEVDEGK